jgi:sarcosine oxidase subunit gamma
VGIVVSGRNAAELLNGGCPLDLASREFPPGNCTRTLFAKAEVVLWRIDAERFQLEVWRSFAGYVSDLLAEIGRELPA